MTDSLRNDVARRLACYRPSSPVEIHYHARMTELVEACPGDPFSRKWFSPGHFTASAFVLGPKRDRLLMIRHEGLGRWLQPGGHIESGDAGVFEAALREVHEETGLAASDLAPGEPQPIDLDIHKIPARGGEPEHEHLDMRFAFVSEAAALPEGAECEAAWFTAAQAFELNSEQAMCRVLAKLQLD